VVDDVETDPGDEEARTAASRQERVETPVERQHGE
jgi:hypothetical protein